MDDAVMRLARRAAADPHFLAFALAAYAAAEGLDEAALMGRLGATPAALTHARLCRAPRPESPGFREDVDRIAAKFGLDREALAAAARRGQVVAALRRETEAADAGTVAPFIAARDKTE